jgi:hypothetical protein
VRALAAVLLVAVAACSGGGGIDLPAPSTTVPDAVTTSTTSSAVPDGLALAIVEQGVISFPDPNASGQTLGGYGVVLENPNQGLLASSVHVTTRILDAAGNELLVDSALLNGIMPGQRMAVGRTIVEPIASPAQLDIQVQVGDWLEPAPGLGTLTATQALTEPEPYGGAATHFAVQSAASAEEDGVDVAAVYRGADGHLLMVETTTVDSLPPGQTVVGQIRLVAPIPGLASTDVLIGRGLSAQTTG